MSRSPVGKASTKQDGFHIYKEKSKAQESVLHFPNSTNNNRNRRTTFDIKLKPTAIPYILQEQYHHYLPAIQDSLKAQNIEP